MSPQLPSSYTHISRLARRSASNAPTVPIDFDVRLVKTPGTLVWVVSGVVTAEYFGVADKVAAMSPNLVDDLAHIGGSTVNLDCRGC